MSLTVEDLEARIKLILSQTERYAKIYALRDPSFDFDYRTRQFDESSRTFPIAAPGDAQITNEQVFLLRTLYAQCDSKLQKSFPPALLGQLTLETAAVVVHSVIDIGHLSALGKALRERKLDPDIRTIIWYRVREKLAMEAHRFTADDLAELEALRAAEVKRIPKVRPPDPEDRVIF